MIIMASTLSAAINGCRHITTNDIVADNLVNLDNTTGSATGNDTGLYDISKPITKYLPVISLSSLTTDRIVNLLKNLYAAAEMTWLDGNDLISGLIMEDITEVETYLDRRKATE